MAQPFSTVFRQLVLPVYAPAFLMSMCQGIALLMIPLYALELGANAGIAALIFSLRGLGNVVFDLPAGSLASKLGDKFTMATGVAIMTFTAFGASHADTPTDLAISAFFFGAGMATWLIGRLTFITEGVAVIHRGKAIATMAGLQRFGSFVGPVAGGLIAANYGFDTVFLIVAILSSVALALVLIFVPRTHKAADHQHESLLVAVPAIIRGNVNVFATAGVAMLMLTIIRASRQLLVPLWGNAIGLGTDEIGFIMGATSAVDMCIFPIAGYIMDNVGRKPAALACLLVLAAGLCLVPFTETVFTLGVAALLVGLGNGLGSGINMTMGADFSPDRNRGEFIGVWRLLSDTGSFGGPVIMGLVIQMLSLGAAFVVIAIAAVAGVIALKSVRETRPGSDNSSGSD